MKKIFLLLIVVAVWSCNSGGSGAAPTLDASGYLVEDIPGLSAKAAYKKDANGNILEEGLLINGLKTGTWVTYHPGTNFPATLISFEGGLYNGVYLEFNERGQMQLRAGYRNNKLHGPWGKYSFGRTEEEADYKDGELHGMYKKFYKRDGKLQSEAEYKNGVQDGVYRFFNEEGAVTLEYQYKNGEKVSGGIIDPTKPNEPK